MNFSPDSTVPADVSTIKLADQTSPNPPTISPHGDKEPITLTGIADPVPGAPICKSGSYTGVTCGTILDIRSQDMGNNTYIDGFGTNLDSYPGDSGAGAFTGTKAIGIQSGSTINKNTKQRLTTNFTTLSTAMQALPGYQLVTEPKPVATPETTPSQAQAPKPAPAPSASTQDKTNSQHVDVLKKDWPLYTFIAVLSLGQILAGIELLIRRKKTKR